MSEKLCPNCFFKNESDSNFCQECGSPINLNEYVESKKLDKTEFNRLKSIVYGKEKTNEINIEIEEFIILSQNFKDYKNDLINLKSGKFDKLEFKNKYAIISKLDDFRYLVEINNDSDLNKKLLLMKSVKTFINNFDDEIKKSEKLLKDINLKISDIERFNEDLEKTLALDSILDISNKNDLIQAHKLTFDFFDRQKVKELNIDSKEIIKDFLNTYENIDSVIEKRNIEFKINKHKELVLISIDKSEEFVNKINELKETEDFLPTNVVVNIQNEFQEAHDFLTKEDISKIDISKQSVVFTFLNDFNRLHEIIDKINDDLSIKILQNKVNDNVEKLNEFNSEFNNLMESKFYITFKQKDKLKEDYQDLFDLISEANEKIGLSDDFKQFLKTYPDIGSIITTRNENYVENELIEHKEFFDNIDGKSLDNNQRLAVVKNELNSQIIAGAGCGKTLTVNAKVRYLIEKKGINPNEILCLSFSNASVNDLKEKLPGGVEIATFHKLGGAILRANDKPARPDTDAMDNYIKEYFRNHVIYNEKLCEDILEFYSYYLYNSISEDQATSLGEVYDIEEAKDFRTFKELYCGDNEKITYDNKRVKSLEELIIANYLFAHQIDYEYEKIFECENKYYLTQKEFVFNLIFSEFDEIIKYPSLCDDLLVNVFELCEIKEEIILKNYSPDFYLNENKIYLEHFGVNRDCNALWLSEEDSDKYREGIYWKRQLNKNYGSRLLETYSYYMAEDRLLSRLEEKLKKAGVEVKEIDVEYLLSKIVERDKVNRYVNFIKLITTFIQLFKGNDYTIDKFEEFRKENENNDDKFDKKRTDLFLNIVEDIYISYENYLKEISKIDFNDMINNATREVEKGNLHRNFRYILVDEYQDTSYTRYNLVKAIQDKTGAKVCVVGDDWQSIYRFTGCDVALFSQFENYFENPIKLKIETTYRNSQELIDITGRFINKNPNQINKSLNSKKDSASKPVKLAYYNNSSKEDKIKKMEFLVDKISAQSNDIMILGRNNFDINDFIDAKLFKRKQRDEPELIYTKNPDLNINFISVHKSKGLEEDNVILINLENKTTGFPNQMIDDPLMNFVINDSDQYPHGEERRLFYVALTRTKNNVYLLVPETDKSEFVIELEEHMEDLEILSQSNQEELYDDVEEFMENKNVYSIKTKLKCPVCKTGDIILKIIKKKDGTNIVKFFECSHKRCDWQGGFYNSDLELLDEIEICPECGGIMFVKNGRYGPFNTCSNRCKVPKLSGEKLNRINNIIKEMEDKIEFETHQSKLTCPKCGQGNVTLRIHPVNKQKSFICSNESCEWEIRKTSINPSDLEKIEICPDCGGILTLKEGKRGKFYGCSNFPKCRFTKNENEKNKSTTITSNITKTHLKCPKCGVGHVSLKGNKFICSSCDWDGGSFSGDKDKLSTLEYCNNPDCTGVTFMRNGRYGEFRTCSNYFKTKCNGKGKKEFKKNKKSYSKKTSKWKKIDTDLSCPSCANGDVILLKNKENGRGFFKCTNDNCDWNGGSFNKSEDLLSTLAPCPEFGCDGLTYEIVGKYGPFRVCTYFGKTGCKAGRK